MAFNKHTPNEQSEVTSNDTQKNTRDIEDGDGSSQQGSDDPDMFYGVHKSVLEAFDNLPVWKNDMPREKRAMFTESFLPPEEETESHALRIIHSKNSIFLNKFIPLPELNSGKKTFHVPGLSEHYHPMFYKKSVLNSKEQNRLYNLYCRTLLKHSVNRPLKAEEISELQVLGNKVASEYAEFQEFAKKEWCKGHWKRACQIPPEVESFTCSLWKMRTCQSLINYPVNYQNVKQIPLSLNDTQDGHSVFEFVKPLLQNSLPPKMILPSGKKQTKLMTELSELCRIKPISTDSLTCPEPLVEEVKPISLDGCAEELVKRNNLDVDVVISMSGIKTLTDANKFSKDWVLPITVKEVSKCDGATKKKVVFIDKKLPTNKMTIHDKNLWHSKVAAKWVLILRKNVPPADKGSKHESESVNNQTTSSGDPTLDTATTQSVELPGCRNPWARRGRGPAARTVVKKREERGLTSYDDPFADFTDDNALVEEFGVNPECQRTQATKKKETKIVNKSPEGHPSKIGKKEKHDLEPGKLVETSEYTMTTSKEKHDFEPGEFVETSEYTMTTSGKHKICHQYQLWKFQKSNFNQFLKTEQRTLRVMVRTRHDGRLTYFENRKNLFDEVCVSSKVEFQPEYGATKMTAAELTREYVDLYLRPGAKLVRVRSIGYTKEVMLTEVKSLNDIKLDLQSVGTNVQKLFDPLYAVLTKLVDLPPSRYMLQHTAKMEAFATLLKETEGSSQFSLAQYCSELINTEASFPPMPIDPLVITALHHRDRVPPALFTPCQNFKKKDGKQRIGFLAKRTMPEELKKIINKTKKNKKNKKRRAIKKAAEAAAAAAAKAEENTVVDFFGGILPQDSNETHS